MNPRSKTASQRTTTALRLSVDQLAEITKRAKAHRMTRTEYMIRAALDDLPAAQSVTERLEALEQRLERLETSRIG